MTRSVGLLMMLGGVLFLSAGVAMSAGPAPLEPVGQGPQQATAETLSPEEQAARTTFETVCGACHDPAVATTTLRTRQEWGELFDLMVSFGASATDAQFTQIQRYLGRRYGRVNLNRAPADELQFVLDVSPAVAQAILDYRSTMRLTSADDLKGISGFPVARLEALKPHLQF